MPDTAFDFTTLINKNLPAPAGPWEGRYPPFNFTGGHNTPEEVPVGDLIAATTRALETYGTSLSTYMLESGYLGHRPLRDYLAGKLKASADISCEPGNILLTSGSLQALDLINAALLSPGDTVLFEEATYAGVISRFERAGATPLAIPLDGGGMRMDALEETLEACRKKGVTPKYIYTIPTVQNPTATIMDEARRHELIALATRYGTAIVEDDCYADLIWPGADGKVHRPPAIHALDAGARTIHIGSFSKSVAPALRVGYIVADWDILGQLVACKGDAGSGALEQMVLAEYCTQHFDTHITNLRRAFKTRLDALVEALEENFGTAASFDVPPGGMYLWIKLPPEVDTTKLAGFAAKEGISINPGADWSWKLPDATQYFRVCFAHPSPDIIREGISRLAILCNKEFGVPTHVANQDRTPRS